MIVYVSALHKIKWKDSEIKKVKYYMRYENKKINNKLHEFQVKLGETF